MGLGYYTNVRVTDYGPYVTKIILPVTDEITAEVSADMFNVYVERKDTKGNILELPKSWMAMDDREPSKGYCPVDNAYLSDETGERAETGSFITLAMKYGPIYKLTAEISAPEGFNVHIVSDYRITQLKEIPSRHGVLSGLVYDQKLGTRCKDTERFLTDKSTDRKIPLRYGYFVPQGKSEKKPLIIWLHGAGEGGQDTSIAYSGNKVTNLASDRIQEKFGGAYILAPQCPTMWMDDGSGEYTKGGKSMYVSALKYLIDEFVENHPEIDRKRIYIGGDSNGGFMTMRICIDYPDFFAAAFPVCEALYDDTIADAQIAKLAELPIWFTHAKNDPVVKPSETVLATYLRLKAAGAENLHFSFWDHIADIHEGFCDENGKPYEYIGHFSWIPMLNDDCDFDDAPEQEEGGRFPCIRESVTVNMKKVTLLDWLALQKR
ncbi:MAG: prolyl oligopeptidase family serine peptidase [Butyrivibrio sp.]|nr:prolyl oligopeptidase family serine peptidase [Butyrivibrio sp.]